MIWGYPHDETETSIEVHNATMPYWPCTFFLLLCSWMDIADIADIADLAQWLSASGTPISQNIKDSTSEVFPWTWPGGIVTDMRSSIQCLTCCIVLSCCWFLSLSSCTWKMNRHEMFGTLWITTKSPIEGSGAYFWHRCCSLVRPVRKCERWKTSRRLAVELPLDFVVSQNPWPSTWGFHSHGGTPKWMVYNGKSMEIHLNGMIWGYSISETSIWP